MAFLGTCTNGRLEDLAVAARSLKGRKVRPGTTLVISPASREVTLEACARGYLPALLESGGIINAPGCGPCVGALGGIPGDGVNVIFTANRNFRRVLPSRRTTGPVAPTSLKPSPLNLLNP